MSIWPKNQVSSFFVKFETISECLPVHNLPPNAASVGAYLAVPQLQDLIPRFLYQQSNPDCDLPLNQIPLALCPDFTGRIRVFPSATSLYYAPSDKSGVRGMYRERICAVKSWRKGPARNDCVFVEQDADEPGFRGLFVAQVRAFLAITHNRNTIPCAVVSEFTTIGDQPCPDTGMWMVKPDYLRGERAISIIHLDSILRGAHLMGIAGKKFIPNHLTLHNSLDAFQAYYVNKYIDHHSHELAF